MIFGLFWSKITVTANFLLPKDVTFFLFENCGWFLISGEFFPVPKKMFSTVSKRVSFFFEIKMFLPQPFSNWRLLSQESSPNSKRCPYWIHCVFSFYRAVCHTWRSKGIPKTSVPWWAPFFFSHSYWSVRSHHWISNFYNISDFFLEFFFQNPKQ